MSELPDERRYSEVINMCIHDKYRMVRMSEQLQEIEAAFEQAKGNPGLSLKNFLPR